MADWRTALYSALGDSYKNDLAQNPLSGVSDAFSSIEIAPQATGVVGKNKKLLADYLKTNWAVLPASQRTSLYSALLEMPEKEEGWSNKDRFAVGLLKGLGSGLSKGLAEGQTANKYRDQYKPLFSGLMGGDTEAAAFTSDIDKPGWTPDKSAAGLQFALANYDTRVDQAKEDKKAKVDLITAALKDPNSSASQTILKETFAKTFPDMANVNFQTVGNVPNPENVPMEQRDFLKAYQGYLAAGVPDDKAAIQARADVDRNSKIASQLVERQVADQQKNSLTLQEMENKARNIANTLGDDLGGNIFTNPGGTLNRWATSVGLGDDGKQEAMRQAKQLAFESMNANRTPGAVSNFETAGLLKTAPQMGTTKADWLAYADKLGQVRAVQEEYGLFLEAYKTVKGSAAGAPAAWNSLKQAYNAETKNPLGIFDQNRPNFAELIVSRPEILGQRAASVTPVAATDTASAPSKVINGATYIKVNGGWQKAS